MSAAGCGRFSARLGKMRKLSLLFLPICCALSQQPQYDLLLKGGHVIDAKSGVSAVRDVAISQGKIAAVAANIPASSARTTVDVSSLYVTPGLVDIHTHVFAGSMGREYIGENCVRPDGFTFRTAVTTVVECLARGTPLLINKIPAVEEYLGADYPLYYSSLCEAEYKLQQKNLIIDGHHHLMASQVRNEITPQAFVQRITSTATYERALNKIGEVDLHPGALQPGGSGETISSGVSAGVSVSGRPPSDTRTSGPPIQPSGMTK